MVRMNDEKEMSGSGDHEEHKEQQQQQGLNEELIEDFPSSYRILRSESSHAIRTRRGSGSRLDFEKDGTSIKEEIELISPGARKISTIINIRRRSTTTILPTPIAPPKRTSKEIIQKESMKLQYIEHEFDLLRLSEYFHTEIDVIDPKNSHGLTSGQAETLLKQFGPNRLTPPEHMPKWVLFFVQFLNYFMILLLLAGSISIASYAIPPHDITNVYLGVLLILVVIFTCVETFMVESQSDELMSKFRAMVPNQASIIRDGVISAISTEELVVGDLILVKSGDKVPADCRIIYVESLKVDQSLVTGEVDPIDVQVQSHNHQPLESKNLIFNGTLVVEGSGIGVVIRTGDESMIGSIVELTGTTHKGSSTLKADIEKFVFVLMIASLIQAILIFVVGIIRGISPLEAFIQGFIGMSHSFFMNSMSEVIFVANIPQGLPSTIAGALYIVAKRMSEKNVLVKKLDIIETLGSCSVICTDKTGTLTLNQMTVTHLWTAADGVLDSSHFETSGLHADSHQTALFLLIHVASLNSRVFFQRSIGDSESSAIGDATELGLYRFFQVVIPSLFNCNLEEFRDSSPKLFEIPFNSRNKWQLSVHKVHWDVEHHIVLLKGAPDVILDKCSHYIGVGGEKRLIDAEFMNHYRTQYEEFGGNGERVLGFAFNNIENSMIKEVLDDHAFVGTVGDVGQPFESIFEDFCFVGQFISSSLFMNLLGLITLMDPARPEVPQAVQDCLAAGVKVVMVTGDHPITAKAIAKNIGVITFSTKEDLAQERGLDISQIDENEVRSIVIHGAMIPLMTEADWTNALNKDQIVFARTSPEQKLIIVQKFTSAGNIVAMTGDGVNDSPALKQAAIGVAMGENGSDVAREAADLVLLDDNFASIVIAIKEGRLLFANLKKSIAYTLAHLSPEIVPIFLWAFIGFPLAINGVLILCIDLLTELLPAMSLIYESPESDLINVPPRNPRVDLLVTPNLLLYSYFQIGFIHTGVCYFVSYLVFSSYGLTFENLAKTNNQYFTANPIGPYSATDGKEFSPSEQKNILDVTQGSWFLMIVIGQAVHIWTCRTLTSSLFHHGFFTNIWTIFGVFIALCIGIFLIYCPGVQDVVMAHNPPSLVILYGALLSIALIIPFTEGRKYLLCLLSPKCDSLLKF